MAKKEIVRLIQELLKRLFQEGISVEKAFLYGSHARGEENEESDIDILLVSALFDQNDDQVVGRAWRISRSIDPRLEPYTMGKEKFSNDHISPLIQIVKKEGVEIRL